MVSNSIARPGTFVLHRWLGSGCKQPLNLNRCDKHVGTSGYHGAADGKQTLTVCLKPGHHLALVGVEAALRSMQDLQLLHRRVLSMESAGWSVSSAVTLEAKVPTCT